MDLSEWYMSLVLVFFLLLLVILVCELWPVETDEDWEKRQKDKETNNENKSLRYRRSRIHRLPFG